MYETDLALCASFEDVTSASRELHPAYETQSGYRGRDGAALLVLLP